MKMQLFSTVSPHRNWRFLWRFFAVFLLACLAMPVHQAQAQTKPKSRPPANAASEVNRATIEKNCDAMPSKSGASPATVSVPSNSLEANAYWLNRRLAKWPGIDQNGTFKLYYSAGGEIAANQKEKVVGSDGALALQVFNGTVPTDAAQRFKYVADGVVLMLRDSDAGNLPALLKKQLVLVQESETGEVRHATMLQIAGALDDIYSDAIKADGLGVHVSSAESNAENTRTAFKLWAPTARQVSLCVYQANGDAKSFDAMRFDESTGVWSLIKPHDLSGNYYLYLVDVVGQNASAGPNRVTDPYAIRLSADSKRSYIANLNSSRLKPQGWDQLPRPSHIASQTDMAIYELHVRDFSFNDPTVSKANRGKYLAFAEVKSNGMKHLAALRKSGMTDIHLLPVFDIATIPEKGCLTPNVKGATDSEDQQAITSKNAANDCFNWGYDPYHFSAPEGSYSSNADDGATRIIEFRKMVMALHRAGLRVGMDVVYNHTSASGQDAKSVLDRIVPGYYHRLDAKGVVEQSTCCANTATENMMMARLMIDSAEVWTREYKIDSFRFDLMGHQPRAAMEALQERVNKSAGRHINLIGEGWNFGEIENSKRFVQASQLSLNGSGIGTFSDRGRDAARGGSAGDSGESLVKNQGYINGLVYAPNAMADKARPVTDLLRAADMVRVGLAGTLRDYLMTTYGGKQQLLSAIDYAGQPAGYASEPSEVVNYVDNHDNQTLFDINVYKLPLDTSRDDRARVQILGASLTAFSQGVAYFHAGIDVLRSKSMDGNSFDSGDWFNRLDWTYQDNYFAVGMPPKRDNEKQYSLIKPLLANARIKPTSKELIWTRDAFRDLLKIRASSHLFRLPSTKEIQSRLTFLNTGATQNPVVIVGHLQGENNVENSQNAIAGADFKEVLYFINVDKTAQTLVLPSEKNKAYVLHPVHKNTDAADKRPATDARFESSVGAFMIPARTAMVYVVK